MNRSVNNASANLLEGEMHNYIRIEKCTWQTKLQTTCNKNSPLEHEFEINIKVQQQYWPTKNVRKYIS